MLVGPTLSEPMKEMRGREIEIRKVHQRGEMRHCAPPRWHCWPWQVLGARGELRKVQGGKSLSRWPPEALAQGLPGSEGGNALEHFFMPEN